MKSEYLHTLVESIATGSFSKAAENLCVTQSAVSRRIKFIEDQYGFPLIDRSGPVLVPTEAGRIVLEKAEKMLSLEKELLHDLQGISSKPGIMFCCTPAFGVVYLTDILKDFMLSNPDTTQLRFFFDMPDKVVDGMREGLYQVGVIEHNENFDLTEFDTFEMPGDEVVFVSAPELGLADGDVSIDQLMHHDLYTRKEGCCSSKLLDYNMKKLGRDYGEFSRVLYYDDLHLIIDSVRTGGGIAFISRPVVQGLVKEGLLRQHRVPGFEHAYRRTLIVNRAVPAAESLLLDNFISSILAALDTSDTDLAASRATQFCTVYRPAA
ncbi:LysR family transcriptional regulator [Geobacter sp. AOG2]|uniref:LysR family transcriptional regulator n=1 Tax=Geobacter sp. AOG2 TaxID=1566347 RepID=UPI001CC55A33|nr:LysR family transcriptional regulator [Geobacter sp. AOG2]